MKERLIIKKGLALLLIGIFVASCSEDEVDMECLYENYETMNMLLDTSKVGNSPGAFPSESYEVLQDARIELEGRISQGLAVYYKEQSKADQYCIESGNAIDTFLNAMNDKVNPGTPAELLVHGIDQQGRIEFGSDPAFAGDDAFSVEAWMKYDEDFFEFALGSFISTFDGTGQPLEGWMISFMDESIRATLCMGPQENRILETGKSYPTNYGEWNHVVMVYDASLSENQLKLYMNGEVYLEKTNDVYNNNNELQNYQPNTRNQSMWAFQEPNDLNRCMTGYIKKFRFWNDAKSLNEIQKLMESDVTGNEAELECAWDFTEVSEDNENIPDKTGNHTAKLVGNYEWILYD